MNPLRSRRRGSAAPDKWWDLGSLLNRPTANHSEEVVDAGFVRKLDRLSLAIGPELFRGLMGEHPARRRTAGIEFAEHRQYVSGDDLRRVDWNAYARLGTMHVRQAQAEHDTMLYLLVDASPSMGFGRPSKFLAARRLAAALGYIALAHLDRVVVAAPGASAGPDGRADTSGTAPSEIRGRAGAGELFRRLQDMRVGNAAEFDRILAGWGSGGGQGRLAVIISDLLLDGYKDGVRLLAASGFQVVLLHLLSLEELRPSDIGTLELVDSETGGKLEMHLGPQGLKEYSRRVDAWLTETQAWAASQGARYFFVRTDQDVERTVLDTLRRGGVTA